MAEDTPASTISLQERSLGLGSEEKFSKWLVFSLLFHLGLIGSLFILPLLPTSTAPSYPVYTVDLVGGEKIGRTNFGTDLAPARVIKETAKREPVAPIQETKRETTKEKAEKVKPIEKTALVQDKVTAKESIKKEPAKKEPPTESKSESKSETASLENVREKLIQSAVERVKNRTETGQKTSKGEEISSGTGTGRGAATLGPGGTGGGVVKGIDFISYQNQMLSTIKNNWVWVGQRANLRVTVHFNIKENGEIVGLKLVQPSGNPSYDDSVLRAVRKSSPLPAPPESVRKDFSDVELAFRPEDLGA
jgi:colicin import membrane protein